MLSHSSTARNITETTKKKLRSKATNVLEFVDGLDMRSSAGRRYRDLTLAFCDDICGQDGPDGLSEADRVLIRQCASATVAAELLQAKIVSGESSDFEALSRAQNVCARLMKSLRARTPVKREPTLAEQLLADRRAREALS